jgi:hypothetical protein
VLFLLIVRINFSEYRERKATLDKNNKQTTHQSNTETTAFQERYEDGKTNNVTKRMRFDKCAVLPEDGLIWPKHVAL